MILRRSPARTAVVVAILAIAACSASPSGNTGAGGGGQHTGAGGTGAGGSAGSAGGFTITTGSGGATACVADKQEATLVKEPVDIIMVVDTSGTMEPASDSVEKNINQNLATALTAGGVDYRLITLASYGSGTDLCIDPPLSGAPCMPNPPPVPANTQSFYHYVRLTGSGALLDNILNWYNAPDESGAAPNGWKQWLRPGAKKVFLVFSDTSSASSAASNGDAFDAGLLALDPTMFGTAAARKYTFHTIIGLQENNPPTAPWLPTDPLIPSTCTGFAISLSPGESLQQVSIVSKGLRFPVCQFGGFDVVFQQIATDVVQKTELACELPFPTAPDGQTIDPNTIQLVYEDGASQSTTFVQVAGPGDCKPNAFYVEGQTLRLCPEACEFVNTDAMGSMDVQYGCDVGFAK